MNRERGSASLLAVSCAGILLLVGAALGVVAAMVVAHRAAQAAADLAALAGAAAVQRGEDGCGVAGGIAVANGASVRECRVVGLDVWVEVVAPGPHWLGQVADLGGRARAGPV